MHDLPIERIMTTEPTTIGPDEPAERARELLAAETIHHLPVVLDGKLIGIVSSSDLLKLYLLADGAGPAAVRHIMEKDPMVLESKDSLRDAAVKLSIGGFHALPVVARDGSLAGIVTSGDLIEHLLHQLPRGDGSIRIPALPAARHGDVTDDAIHAALEAAEDAVGRGADDDRMARVLLFFRDRNRRLREVCKAAELYMRSGHSEREHSVLVKCLSDVRDNESTTL